ncbi:Uncharacterised protein [Corynebacterium kutscheri]|uniref:Secreted protein n=1 Tax=Corynebacterium kutscheri TaxID=35755 RepID=A0AB38VTL2_9CORY|nr:hypothetical protein [Corynebacterium kutscheri]VEH08902.1 Uncharacterised protein [Corynebacterium kutscheri]VEH80032.1 Uncharacterised protein [Corynebacterium kutscheri]
MITERTFGKMTGTILVGLSVAFASAAPAQATEIPNSKLSHNQAAEKNQTITYSDGTTVTAVMTEDGQNVQLYLNGEYVKTASLEELAVAAKTAESAQSGDIQPRSACGHILNGLAAANGLLWVAAGLTAGTGNLPATAVAGVAGVVTSGIIGAAGAEC